MDKVYFEKFKEKYNRETSAYRRRFVDGNMYILDYACVCIMPLLQMQNEFPFDAEVYKELDLMLCETLFPPVRTKV